MERAQQKNKVENQDSRQHAQPAICTCKVLHVQEWLGQAIIKISATCPVHGKYKQQADAQ
jgi:hypothetical protein